MHRTWCTLLTALGRAASLYLKILSSYYCMVASYKFPVPIMQHSFSRSTDREHVRPRAYVPLSRCSTVLICNCIPSDGVIVGIGRTSRHRHVRIDIADRTVRVGGRHSRVNLLVTEDWYFTEGRDCAGSSCRLTFSGSSFGRRATFTNQV